MRLADFIRKGQVRLSSKDVALIKALVATSVTDIGFLKGLEITPASARKIMSNYYDVLRSILEAVAATDGYKIYSHEAFAYLLKEKGEDVIAEKIDRFRKIRNKINYYGKDISVEEAKQNSEEIIKLIESLKKKYLKDVK